MVNGDAMSNNDNNNNNNNITLNEDDNNNNYHHNDNNNVEPRTTTNNNAEESNRPACSACKHQRKKCIKEQCLLLKHFPAEKAGIFATVHKVFGIATLNKMIQVLEADEQEKAVMSFEWEALQWEKDNVNGPFGEYKNLEKQNQLIKEEYQKLLEENRLLKEHLRTMQQPPIENSSNIAAGVLPPLLLQHGNIGNMTNYCHGSTVPAACAYYNVNHAQALANMGSHHVGQSSRTSYSTIHPSTDIQSVYPISQHHHQLMNSGQRKTPG